MRVQILHSTNPMHMIDAITLNRTFNQPCERMRQQFAQDRHTDYTTVATLDLPDGDDEAVLSAVYHASNHGLDAARDWPRAARSSTSGDIFVLDPDGEARQYVVAGFGFVRLPDALIAQMAPTGPTGPTLSTPL